jgi:hypothetical protein
MAMRNWSSKIGFGLTACLAAGALALMTGCADDLYAPCDLDVNSPDQAVAACGSNDGPARSCVVDNQIQCDTRSCGRYQGSDPFCTRQCQSDGDCPGGVCTELVFQSGVKYCVQQDLI